MACSPRSWENLSEHDRAVRPFKISVQMGSLLQSHIRIVIFPLIGVGWVCGHAQAKTNSARCAAEDHYGLNTISFAALLMLKSIVLPVCHPYGICVVVIHVQVVTLQRITISG